MDGFQALANALSGIAGDLRKRELAGLERDGYFAGRNAVKRTVDGTIAPVSFLEWDTAYGAGFNKGVNEAFTAGVMGAAREAFGGAAARNPDRPDAFDAFAKTWIDQQVQAAPEALRGPLGLDLSELAGQHRNRLVETVARTERLRKTLGIANEAEA